MSIYGLQRSRFTRPADARRTAPDGQNPEPAGRRGESRDKPPDQVLVKRLHGGDRGAFETIFRRYHPPLLSYCRHMLGSRDEAEDVLQQTFIRAHRALVSGSPPRELRPWLYTIARNCCHSAIAARRPSTDLEGHEPAIDGLAAIVADRADLRELVGDLQALPEDQRSALLLAELGDLSHEQIAGVVDCQPRKVKALIHQARTTLIAQRDARAASCEEIRAQLSVARGGELRRGPLRRHLGVCPGCRDFAAAVGAQRTSLAAVLPVLPTAGLALRILGHTAAGAASAGAGGLGLAGGGHAAAAAAVTGGGSASAGASGAGAVSGISAAGASAGGAGAAGSLSVAAGSATGATGLSAAAGTAAGAGGLTAGAGTATGVTGFAAAGGGSAAVAGVGAAAGTATAATGLTATAATASAAGGLAASGAGVSAAGALAAGGAGASGAGGVAAALGGGLAAKLAVGGAVAVIASAGAAATLHGRSHPARRVSSSAIGGHRSQTSAAKALAKLKRARSASVAGENPKPTVATAAKPSAGTAVEKSGPKAAGLAANGSKAGRTKPAKAPTTASRGVKPPSATKPVKSASAKTSPPKAGSHTPKVPKAASSRGKTTRTASGTTGPTGSTSTAARRAPAKRPGAKRPPATKRKIRGSGRLHPATGLAGTSGAAKTNLKPTGRGKAKRRPPTGVTTPSATVTRDRTRGATVAAANPQVS
jgi:RNA polymerase sigma factor (sigma-70 family)